MDARRSLAGKCCLRAPVIQCAHNLRCSSMHLIKSVLSHGSATSVGKTLKIFFIFNFATCSVYCIPYIRQWFRNDLFCPRAKASALHISFTSFRCYCFNYSQSATKWCLSHALFFPLLAPCARMSKRFNSPMDVLIVQPRTRLNYTLPLEPGTRRNGNVSHIRSYECHYSPKCNHDQTNSAYKFN